MSLPSSTRSASSATQAILIHIDLGQHGHGYGFGIHGVQFVDPLDDAATTASSAASQSVPSSADAGHTSLLPGLSVLAIATTHNHHRAGPSACHAGIDHAPAPHRALLVWAEFLGGTGSAGPTRPQAALLEVLHTGAADRWLSSGTGIRLPASSSPAESHLPSPPRQSGCTCSDGFLLRAALKDISI